MLGCGGDDSSSTPDPPKVNDGFTILTGLEKACPEPTGAGYSDSFAEPGKYGDGAYIRCGSDWMYVTWDGHIKGKDE